LVPPWEKNSYLGSNFPGDYGNERRNCIVTVVVPAGKKIQLTFTTFNVEPGKAFIYVRLIQFVFIEMLSPK
jgi:hypothetical protein